MFSNNLPDLRVKKNPWSQKKHQLSRDSWMYPYQRTPYGKSLKKHPTKSGYLWVKWSSRIPREHNKNRWGNTDRGTPILVPWSWWREEFPTQAAPLKPAKAPPGRVKGFTAGPRDFCSSNSLVWRICLYNIYVYVCKYMICIRYTI